MRWLLFIGRLKIERRPFLILRFEAESTTGQVILQQAETVRLVQPSGSVVSITDISIGDEIMIRNDSQMRHVGIALAGEMNEK
jgi:3-dehydroquinate synthase II